MNFIRRGVGAPASLAGRKVGPTIGAEIGNIDLTRPLTSLELAELKRAFSENLVVFFLDQKMTGAQPLGGSAELAPDWRSFARYAARRS